MVKSRETYTREGRNYAFVAKPVLGYGLGAAALLIVAWVGLELFVKRYLKWALWVVKKGRGTVVGGVGAVLFAGLGIEVLRLYDSVYLDGQWYKVGEYEKCMEAGAPSPLRSGKRRIVLKDGRQYETALSRDMVEWAFAGGGRGSGTV